MSKILLKSWGTWIGVVPFIILLIYGATYISLNAKGALDVNSWILNKLAVLIVSVIIFVGIAIVVGRR